MLYADAGDLFRLDFKPDGTAAREQIAAGYGRATPVVFAEVNEAVYFTDGLRVGSYHHPFQGLFLEACLSTRAVETCERAMRPST
ncbi:hypothetical protein [Pantoea sp. 18069]|uniref:hypothetical protein n=1 Tax=Pantoea sp. 18069 TaxID=2681415 RepID=UPI00135C7F8D|nr:hypothetical protein [Pantoea sp. 18069]